MVVAETMAYLGMVLFTINLWFDPPPLKPEPPIFINQCVRDGTLESRPISVDIFFPTYSEDPELNPHAVRYEKLTYSQVLRDNLHVMDMTAISLCREAKMPILVFNFKREGNIERAIAGHDLGTIVSV